MCFLQFPQASTVTNKAPNLAESGTESDTKKPLYQKETVCPKCQAVGTLRRRHTEGVLPVVARALTPYRRYLCTECGRTMWRHSHSKPHIFSAIGRGLTPTFWIILALVAMAVLLGRMIAH